MVEEKEDTPTSRWKECRVNMRLLPMKSHFFFFYGAMGAVIPYMPVIAKGMGINATAVGLIFTVLPFCVFFSKPLFGYLTDYFRNIRLIVFILVTVTSVFFIVVIFLPPILENYWTRVNVTCESQQRYLSILPHTFNNSCLKDTLINGTTCDLKYDTCNNGAIKLRGAIFVANETPFWESGSVNNDLWLMYVPENNFTCVCIDANSSHISCPETTLESCLPEDETEAFSVYGTYQFWVFTFLAVISGTGSATVFCLSDAACYEILGDKPQLYGRQRLWATISWGFATFIAGSLNDIAPASSIVSSYAPGFYLMLGLVAIDMTILFNIKLTKANFSINICKDIGKILSSCEIVGFSVAVYIIGSLTGLLWQYQLWFLQDLGASQTLLGLVVAVQCLAAEVPLFFFAGWFIKTFGYFNCVTLSFAAFALRYGLYYILQDPWLVLPIEVLHGVSYALFYAAMTGYASERAPPGAEATLMGILGGLFEGLGVATGSLLGGLGFDKLGGRETFLVASGVSLICVPSLSILSYTIRRFASRKERQPLSQKQLPHKQSEF